MKILVLAAYGLQPGGTVAGFHWSGGTERAPVPTTPLLNCDIHCKAII
jgi:hypothetical protein